MSRKSKWLVPITLVLLLTVIVTACAAPTPITREVQVTEVVEVEKVVERTPEPIGGDLVLYACLFDPDKLQVLFNMFKDRYGVSRKFAIPLLEYLDRERVTRRIGDVRIVL